MALSVREVAAAFGLDGDPVLLAGGQGTTYRVGKGVIKPVENPYEAEWIAEISRGLIQHGFVTPRPLSASGSWTVQGWIGWEWIPALHIQGQWSEKIAACKAYHRALAGIPRPPWIGSRDNPWEEADKMAWGDIRLKCHAETRPMVDRLLKMIAPTELPSQLIHGDFSGNVMFLPDRTPVVIDFSPTWRPVVFAIGVFIADAIGWEGAEPSIFDLVADEPEIRPLTARAALRRLLECDRRAARGVIPVETVRTHAPFIDVLEHWG